MHQDNNQRTEQQTCATSYSQRATRLIFPRAAVIGRQRGQESCRQSAVQGKGSTVDSFFSVAALLSTVAVKLLLEVKKRSKISSPTETNKNQPNQHQPTKKKRGAPSTHNNHGPDLVSVHIHIFTTPAVEDDKEQPTTQTNRGKGELK